MKVDVTTLDGEKMTHKHATQPLGTALRTAPALRATATDDTTGVATTIEAHYRPDEGRYVVTSIRNAAVREHFDQRALRRMTPGAILKVAVRHCVAVNILAEPEENWISVRDLTKDGGSILPEWMVEAATRRGAKEDRYDVIQVLYGASAVAGIPPVRTVQEELGIPHRTASDWIKSARKHGYLEGMNYNVGRQADG